MPKPREGVKRRSDKEFIQISPWQDKKQQPSLEQLEQQRNTAFVPLVALSSRRDPQPQPPPRALACPEGVSSGWMNHRSSGSAEQQQQQQQQDEEDLTEEECEHGGTTIASEEPHPAVQGQHHQGIQEEEDDWLQPVHHPSHPPHHKHQHQQLRNQASPGGEGDEQEEEEELQERLLQQHRQKQEQHAPFKLRPSEAGLSGLCRLALLPGGHLTGHLADTRTRKCYGLMGTRVAVGGGGCRHDEDVEFLCMSLLTFGSNDRDVSAAVVKTGGDYARIEPAEEGDLARFPELRMRMRSGSGRPLVSHNAASAEDNRRSASKLTEGDANASGHPQSGSGVDNGVSEWSAGAAGDASTRPSGSANGVQSNEPGLRPSLLAEEEGLIGVEQLLATRIHFVPSVLHDGPQADQHLAAFAPKLKGRGAAVTMGTMRVDGLPEDFA